MRILTSNRRPMAVSMITVAVPLPSGRANAYNRAWQSIFDMLLEMRDDRSNSTRESHNSIDHNRRTLLAMETHVQTTGEQNCRLYTGDTGN